MYVPVHEQIMGSLIHIETQTGFFSGNTVLGCLNFSLQFFFEHQIQNTAIVQHAMNT